MYVSVRNITSSEYCDRETDLYRGLVLYLLKVAFGHLFFNQPLDGALCSGWVYVPNLKLRVYNSVRNITIEDLICIGASSGIFYKICIGALSCIAVLRRCPVLGVATQQYKSGWGLVFWLGRTVQIRD